MKKKITLVFTALLLVLCVPSAQANLLDGYSNGDVISTVGTGSISAVNNYDSNANDVAVVFDSNETGTADPDLQYNTGWTGGNIATHYENNALGNLMILPENNNYLNTPPRPNDTSAGGVITIDFSNSPLDFFDFSVVDVESFEASKYKVTFSDSGAAADVTWNFADLKTLRDATIDWGGDNTANYIKGFTTAELGFSGIDEVTFTYGGSGGIALGAPVPVPAAVWLLGSGLLGLVGMRRRRAK